MRNEDLSKELVFMLRKLEDKEINLIKDIMIILAKKENQVD